MKSLNVLKSSWKVGDTREVTEEQLEQMVDDGLYESYDQTYELNNLKWKIVHRVAHEDGLTVYTMAAIDQA